MILPHFVLTKIATICNNNESQSANSFQRWFIGIRIFQVLPVKIRSLVCTLLDNLFPEKHLRMIFQKQWVRDITNNQRPL